MLKVIITKRFKQEMRRASRRGKDLDKLDPIITTLASQQPLAEHFKDHALSGKYAGARECHIEPDWLLVYEIDRNTAELRLARTGTHADLFDK